MKKSGFTLVELMVVIAVLGILAAVGTPKLTTAIAKSKASELTPAAGTYIKLQDAYVIEHKQVGSWKRIGYSAPKSSNFKYSKDALSKLNGNQAGELGVGWRAENNVPLSDCAGGNKWTVTVSSLGVDSDKNILMSYKSEVTSDKCILLASGWGVAAGGHVVADASGSGNENVESGGEIPSGDNDENVVEPETPAETPTETPAETPSTDQDKYKACTASNGNGWLNGQKNGWEKDSAKNACLELRASLKSTGVLVCKGNTKSDDCNLEFKDNASECEYTGNKCK